MQPLRQTSGQVLVLVLLVVLIGMTVGLSIASRSLKSIQNSGDLDQSNRAFSAAEAGIERVLRLGSTCTSGDCLTNTTIGDAKVSVVAEPTSGTPGAGFGNNSVAQDDVFQIVLDGNPGSRAMSVCWGEPNSIAAALVVSVIYENGGTISMKKVAIDGNGGRRAQNGFQAPSVSSGPTTNVSCNGGSQVGIKTYGQKSDINLSGIPGTAILRLARARVMYAGNQQIAIIPVGGWALPAQGTYFTSTAVVGDKQRTVRVFRSTPQLPAIFDYALFNGSTNALQK
jgi:hypothetical protein